MRFALAALALRRDALLEHLNYKQTLIAVAEDCPVSKSTVPEPRGGKKTIAALQYELIRSNPNRYTSAEVLFETSMRHKGLCASDVKSKRKALWAEFFQKPQACLRASPLPKKYGFAIHCDASGKVALCPMSPPSTGAYYRAPSRM